MTDLHDLATVSGSIGVEANVIIGATQPAPLNCQLLYCSCDAHKQAQLLCKSQDTRFAAVVRHHRIDKRKLLLPLTAHVDKFPFRYLSCCSQEFHVETCHKLKALHMYDCLRANKSTSAWGLEVLPAPHDISSCELTNQGLCSSRFFACHHHCWETVNEHILITQPKRVLVYKADDPYMSSFARNCATQRIAISWRFC